MGWGRGVVWIPAGASANWRAPYLSKGMGGSQLLPSLLDSPPPKFHISRNLQGADGDSGVPQSPSSRRLVQAGTVGDGGQGEGGEGCRGAPTGPKAARAASSQTPAASGAEVPFPPDPAPPRPCS